MPKGVLLEGKKALENELIDRSSVFSNAKKMDSANEGMPIDNSNDTTASNTLNDGAPRKSQ